MKKDFLMTLQEEISIDCPKCKHAQKTQIWRTLNVTVSPEDKELLFKGGVNVFHCANCGHKAGIDTPLMYHDMVLRYNVQFYPSQLLNDEQFYEPFRADGSINIAGAPPNIPMPDDGTMYLTKPHIVFNMNELLAYVVFRDKLAKAKGETGI
jgi:hypothetical protein